MYYVHCTDYINTRTVLLMNKRYTNELSTNESYVYGTHDNNISGEGGKSGVLVAVGRPYIKRMQSVCKDSM